MKFKLMAATVVIAWLTAVFQTSASQPKPVESTKVTGATGGTITYIIENNDTAARRIDRAKAADIMKVMEYTRWINMTRQAIDGIFDSFRSNFVNTPKEFWDNIEKDVDTLAIEKLTVAVFDRYFTHDEIKEILEFIETPTGRKFIGSANDIAAEIYKASDNWSSKLSRKLMDLLKKEGYLNEGE